MPKRTISPRKAEIIKTAGELFASRGFQGTSLRDIGEAVELQPRVVQGLYPARRGGDPARVEHEQGK